MTGFIPGRRGFLKAALVPAAGALPAAGLVSAANAANDRPAAYERAYLSSGEMDWIEAAVARLIPTDALGPGAKEARVAEFIDRQLAGPFGRAETWYMQGPWQQGTEQQGYQLKLTPAQLYRAAIAGVDAYCATSYANRAFAALDATQQDAVLHALEDGKVDLPQAPAKVFFGMLLQNTIEGFLSDPMYHGNRDFAGWKLIGFPGPRYNYVDEIGQHGKRFTLPTVGLLGRDGTRTRES